MAILVTTRKAVKPRSCGTCNADIRIGARYIRIFHTREELLPLATFTECRICAPLSRRKKLTEAPAKRRRKARKAASAPAVAAAPAPAPAPAAVVRGKSMRLVFTTAAAAPAAQGITVPARSVSAAAFRQMMGQDA